MIDRLFFAVLVLNATGLFRFVAPQFGVTIGEVSLTLFGLNVSYLVVKARYSTAILLRSGMGGWLFVLLVWPLLTLLYAPSFEIREIGLLLYYFSLFFGTVVYTVANGLPAMHRLMSVSLAITLFGMLLSMVVPEYFESVAALGDAKTHYQSRSFGFFMQPNRLAASIGFLFIGWFTLWRRKNTLLEVGTIMGFLFAMLLTGSRTGIAMAVIVVTLITAHSWRKRILRARYLLRLGMLAACLAGGIIGGRSYISSLDDERSLGLVRRMKTLLTFNMTDADSLLEDGSVQARLETQSVYLSLVEEKALWGHGFGADVYYQEDGTILKEAHSTALTCAMEYGVLYPFVFGLLCLSIYGKRSRRAVERALGTNSVVQFVVILLLLFVVAHGTLEIRVFYVVWGMFFAVIYCPQYLFRYDKTTGRISACLPCRDISKCSAQGRMFRKELESSVSPEYGMTKGGGLHS